jgi:hypothetical protein
VPRAVQDRDPAAVLPAQEAEQELGHAAVIGTISSLLNLRTGAATAFCAACSLHSDHGVGLFRRTGHTKSTLPPAGVLRRERRALLKFREERLRDLGGLLLEMFRRDRFREDLVRERCEELLEIDAHLTSIDTALGLAWTRPGSDLCTCGSPRADGARFCAACGRPVGEARQAPPLGTAESERSAQVSEH